jgi:hypothetical protein
MKAEFLAKWIASANVDHYKNEKQNKEVFIATENNKQLVLTCCRVSYPNGVYAHINIVWIDNGVSKLIYQDILSEGRIVCSTGCIEGDFTARENVEIICLAFLACLENND